MPKVDTVRTNGRKVRSLRTARGWTVSELARRIGRSSRTIEDCENGRRAVSMTVAGRIARAFRATLEEILAEPAAAGEQNPFMIDPLTGIAENAI